MEVAGRYGVKGVCKCKIKVSLKESNFFTSAKNVPIKTQVKYSVTLRLTMRNATLHFVSKISKNFHNIFNKF